MKVVSSTGETIELGTIETAPTIGITDYSRRVTDDYGVTTVVERSFSRRMSVRLAVPFDDVDALQRRLAELRATPATWIADDRFASLTVTGFYKEFGVDHAVPPLSYCTLSVEGLAETAPIADAGEDPAVIGTSTLQLLQPAAIGDANLVASSVAETDAAAWTAGVTYPTGARVMLAATHRIYESVVDGNVGADPAGVSGKWLDVAPTNRWAMFDQALGSATSAAGSIVVTLDSASIRAVALLDVVGATAQVRAPGYDRTLPVGAGAITFLDLPAGIGRVTVTITGPGTVSVGTLLIGRLVGLGVTEASPTSGITDYSRKVTDDFGDVTVVPRAFAKRMAAKALIRSDAVDLVAARIAAVRARPLLWIGQDGIDSLTVYGFFKDFSIEIGEGVSKLALSIEGLSAAAKIAPLGASVNWPDIADPTGTKPTDNADKTGDHTAKDTNAVGGTPSRDVLAGIAKIAPIEQRFTPIESSVSALELAKVGTNAALASLARAGADQDAVLRQIERDAGRLDETLLRLLSESSRTRTVLRDAGIVVDPVTGIVRIYAVDQLADRTSRAEQTLDGQKALISSKASVDYVAEQIALAVLDPAQAAQLAPIITRLTQAESAIDGLNAAITLKASVLELTAVGGRVSTVAQQLDALAGTVSTKASQTTVDQQGIRLGSVEQTLTTLGNVSGITVTIRQARAVADGAAAASLAGLLAADNADRRLVAAQAEIRQELYTKIVDGLSAEAVARTVLSVQIGDLDSRSVEETIARITGETVLGQRIDALGVTSGEQAAAIATLSKASIEAGVGIAGVATTIRQQARVEDQSAEALLTSMIAGDQATRRRADQLVQIQTEFTTTLVANEAASAIARQALLTRMNLAEAAIVTTSKVLADTTQALTSRIEAAEAVFGDATTGLAATRARLIQEETLRASADRANASAISLVDAAVNDPVSGLPATRAVIAQDRAASVTRDDANARDIQQLSAQVNDAATGLPATAARVTSEAEASATRDTALGRRVDVVQADLGTTTASVATQAEASLTRDTALGRRVDTVQADLGTTNATVTANRQAQVDGDQAIARLVEQVRAVIDGVGSVGLQQAFEAVVTRLGKIEGRYAVSIDVNGNLSGFQLIGGATGPASFNLINTDLRMGTGRIVFNNGTFMQVQGVAFGAARDLLEWFGPTMAIDQCSRANAKIYKAIDGDAYYGGSLTAGQLKNNTSSSGLGAGEVAQLGPFGSNGGAVKYIVSWSYRSEMTRIYPATGTGLQQYRASAAAFGATGDGFDDFGSKTVEHPASTITLTRSMAGAAFAQIDQRSFTSETQTFAGVAPTVGDAPGRATFITTIGGGFTVNDPSMLAADRTLRLTLARGFTIGEGNVSQRLTIVSLEE